MATTPQTFLPRSTAMLRLSEIFLSIQGEGPSAGTPAHFMRLQGCDVGCHWCDTRYSWAPDGGEAMDIAGVVRHAKALGESPLAVVTGGEPLQHPGLGALLDAVLSGWPRVEVETSGILPPPRSHPSLYYNVSPKLPTATERWKETWRHVAAWIAEPRAVFKIVVGDPPDAEQAVALVDEHEVPASRVMLMPEGLTEDRVRAHARLVVDACKRHGFRMSPRLHVWLWGPKRGV